MMWKKIKSLSLERIRGKREDTAGHEHETTPKKKNAVQKFLMMGVFREELTKDGLLEQAGD
jgi:hypothetical protein